MMGRLDDVWKPFDTHMSMSKVALPEPSDSFLCDLRTVHEHLLAHPMIRIGYRDYATFKADLIRVYEADRLGQSLSKYNEPSLETLQTLENAFQRIHESLRAEIRTLLPNGLNSLPEQDPARCPISLFGTIEFGHRETAHTRTIAWFLDPKGNHGYGDALLRTFLGCIRPNEAIDYSRVTAEAEKPISGPLGDGRLDIAITGHWKSRSEKWHVIIEAKVDADEGEDQCSLYEAAMKDEQDAGDEVIFVFLSKEGRAPQTAGVKTTQQWLRLSYLQLASHWRRHLNIAQGTPLPAGHHMLRHYLAGVLMDLYRWKLDECLSGISSPEDLHIYLEGKWS